MSNSDNFDAGLGLGFILAATVFIGGILFFSIGSPSVQDFQYKQDCVVVDSGRYHNFDDGIYCLYQSPIPEE